MFTTAKDIVDDFKACIVEHPDVVELLPNDLLAGLAASAMNELLRRWPKPVPVEEHAFGDMETAARKLLVGFDHDDAFVLMDDRGMPIL